MLVKKNYESKTDGQFLVYFKYLPSYYLASDNLNFVLSIEVDFNNKQMSFIEVNKYFQLVLTIFKYTNRNEEFCFEKKQEET